MNITRTLLAIPCEIDLIISHINAVTWCLVIQLRRAVIVRFSATVDCELSPDSFH